MTPAVSLRRAILATTLTVCGLLGVPGQPAYGEEPQASRQKLEALEERIADISQWLEDAEADRSSLVANLRSLEQELGRINSRLHELNQEQERLEQRLDELEQEARSLREQLNSQRQVLAGQLRNAWMAGKAPALKVLLNETDPQQFARQMTYHEYLSQDAVQRLETFQRHLSELQKNREQTLTARNELSQARQEAQTRQQQRKERQAERETALAALKEDIAERQSELEQLQADRKRLQDLLEQVQAAVRDMELPAESVPFQQLTGQLPWPARGKVLANYGESMAGGKLRRNGIVIDTGPEDPVFAVHYGRVVFADWLRGFGLMLILDHGDGYMSLYGHNDALLKRVGDWVRAGEHIALAGDGGNPPGLYFEIRHNGKPGNPKPWLQSR